MPTPRPDIVELLVESAFDGLIAEARGTTTDEVISACLTLTSRVAEILIKKGASPDVIREGVLRLYNELPPPVVN